METSTPTGFTKQRAKYVINEDYLGHRKAVTYYNQNKIRSGSFVRLYHYNWLILQCVRLYNIDFVRHSRTACMSSSFSAFSSKGIKAAGKKEINEEMPLCQLNDAHINWNSTLWLCVP
jgi:hypothetical protein